MARAKTFVQKKGKVFSVSVKSAVYSAAVLAAFFVFSSGNRFGTACSLALFAAITYFNKKHILNFMLYSAATLLALPQLATLYCAVLPAAVFTVFMAALTKTRKKYSPAMFAAALALSRLFVFIDLGAANQPFDFIVDSAVAGLMFLVCVNCLKAPLLRGLKLKLTADELVCFAAVIFSFYAGLYPLQVAGCKLYVVFGAFSLLLLLYLYPLSVALCYGLIIGAAASVLSQNPAYLGVFAVYALSAAVFRDTSRYLSAVAVVLTDLLLAYFFKVYPSYSYLDIIAIASGCALFMLVSQRNISRIADTFGANGERQLSRHIVNRTRAELNQKLIRISEVFYEMERIFAGMVKGYMPPQEAVEMLSGEAMQEVCGSCPDCSRCFKNHRTDAERGYKSAVASGIDKGKITLLDIPPEHASVCSRTNSVLSVCGRLANSYRQYAIVASNLDTGRSLIGRQFKGVGEILGQLAKETQNSVGFDERTEKVIMEELAYNNIVCAEAAVYNENNRDTQISLLIKNQSGYDKSVSRIISSLMSQRMVVKSREDSRREGFCVLHLKPAPKFDVVFGAAGAAKQGSEVSGDTHSLTRIADDKFLIALCDGMGSGKDAEHISSTAISMVENFYRAGFDSETILSGVNRLLNVGNDDSFAALDICALDLTRGICDFIKLGAPEGFIKGKKHTTMINSGALPVGILEELKPSICTKQLSYGDIIVLLSDGISDAFGDREKLKEFIFSEETTNPQDLATAVLTKAIALSGESPKDDMTVLTMRVFTPF